MGQRTARDWKVRKCEWVFRNEKKIREAVFEARACASKRRENTGHGYISDPTAAVAVRRSDPLPVVEFDGGRCERPETWLLVVAAVRRWCGEDNIRASIFRRRYEIGESYVKTCQRVHVSSSTYHSILGEIRNFAIQCAAQAQLIQVFTVAPVEGSTSAEKDAPIQIHQETK